MKKNVIGLLVLCVAAATLNACSSGSGPPSDIANIPTASFAVSTVSVAENASTVITINLSSAPGRTVTVPFTITGTATGSDYTITGSPITIPEGSRSATIDFSSIDDAIDEANETVTLSMGVPSNARRGGTIVTTVIIIDDEVTPGAILGRVTNSVSGEAVEDVAISGGGIATTSTPTGAYSLTPVATSARILTNYTNDGFVPQSRTTEAFSDDFVQVLANVPMVAIALVDTFDPAAATTISVAGTFAQVQIPAGSLRVAGGAAPTGMATGSVTPIAPASNLGVMTGNYLAATAGAPVPFETYGALDARFVDAGDNPLDLAGGTLVIQIPVSTRSSTVPPTATLYYFDSAAGLWRTDGTATLQGTAPDQYYVATVTHASTTWAAGQAYSTVNVTGCVETPAGTRLADAVVTAEGTNYTGLTNAITDLNGSFTVAVRTNSDAFLQASKGTAISNSPPITTFTGNITLTTCLVLAPSTLSIKLSWGVSPFDLDSHTLGANSSDHIYYISQGDLTALPFVALDVDDTSGSGPEVTTITSLAQDRTYRFYVHNYSNTFAPGQTGSPARVELTYNGIQTLFTPPGGETSLTPYWHVFDLITDVNCTPTIVPVDQFRATEPINANVGNSATFCD